MGAPGIISGTVTARGRGPIADARVYFTGGPDPLPDVATLTDEKGKFSLAAPSPGKYELQISADGFKQNSVTVESSPGKTVDLDIELKPER